MQFSAAETAAILGSSRRQGNTRRALDWALQDRPVTLLDLAEWQIGPFDYQHGNQDDDFIPLAEILLTKRLWVVATPVYWYAMSAQMKTLYDRLSDLLSLRKDLGRRLQDISVVVLASGVRSELPEGFEVPFRSTCEYLGMRYIGAHYAVFGGDDAIVAGESARAAAFGAALVQAPR